MIRGRKISNLRFADDTLLLAHSEDELIALTERLERASLECGLEINVRKTKTMIIDRANDNRPNTLSVGKYEVLDHFVYLGAVINSRGCCEAEIRRRIHLGRTAMSQLTPVWKNRNITRRSTLSMRLSSLCLVVRPRREHYVRLTAAGWMRSRCGVGGECSGGGYPGLRDEPTSPSSTRLGPSNDYQVWFTLAY